MRSTCFAALLLHQAKSRPERLQPCCTRAGCSTHRKRLPLPCSKAMQPKKRGRSSWSFSKLPCGSTCTPPENPHKGSKVGVFLFHSIYTYRSVSKALTCPPIPL